MAQLRTSSAGRRAGGRRAVSPWARKGTQAEIAVAETWGRTAHDSGVGDFGALRRPCGSALTHA